MNFLMYEKENKLTLEHKMSYNEEYTLFGGEVASPGTALEHSSVNENWAKNEVDLIVSRNTSDDDFDYVGKCAESAFKAYQSLLSDGHSGMSISITKNLLDRLISLKPLTPLSNEPDQWEEKIPIDPTVDGVEYIHKRYPSLTKTVRKNAINEYNDCDLFSCVNINNPTVTFSSGFVIRKVKDLYPITFPYYPPTTPYLIYTDDYLFNPENGDFDSIAILYVVDGYGNKKDVNKFYREINGKFIEISQRQYYDEKVKMELTKGDSKSENEGRVI